MKKQPKIFKVYLLVSTLIVVVLPMLLEIITKLYPESYPPGEAFPNENTTTVAGEIAMYIWPFLIGYIIFVIAMLSKKINNRKIIYPLSLAVISYILFFLAFIYYTVLVAIMWAFILVIPLIVIMIILSVVGWKLDNKRK